MNIIANIILYGVLTFTVAIFLHGWVIPYIQEKYNIARCAYKIRKLARKQDDKEVKRTLNEIADGVQDIGRDIKL